MECWQGTKKLNPSFSVCRQKAEKGTLLSDPLVVNIQISQMEELRLLGVAQIARKGVTTTDEEENGEFSETYSFGTFS